MNLSTRDLNSSKLNPLAQSTKENTNSTKLKQEVQQLQHKLKLRTKAVTMLQNKLQTKQDLDKIA